MVTQETKLAIRELSGVNGLSGEAELDQQLLLTVFLEDETARRIDLVGGKVFGLAELKAIPETARKVPDGSVVIAPIYDLILQQNPAIRTRIKNLDEVSSRWIKAKLAGNNESVLALEGQITAAGKILKGMIEEVNVSTFLQDKIGRDYDELCRKVGEENMVVMVRSSGTEEDGADKSFAGQNKTEPNRRGKKEVIISVRKCLASQFEERAINYRNDERLRISKQVLEDKPEENIDTVLAASERFSHSESRLAVLVQKMIKSSVSGVALSIDPTTGASRINIELNRGMGESVVGGEVTPDFFEVDLRTGEIVGRRLGAKGVRISYVDGGTGSIQVSEEDSNEFAASDAKVIEIAKDVIAVRKALGKEVDMEFALDENGELYWVQERSETVGSKKDPHIVEIREYKVPEEAAKNADLILKDGITGCPGAACGTKLIANTVEEARTILESSENKGKHWILAADMTTPEWVSVMRNVDGIITRRGGRTCHAAIVSREMRIPCLVGTEKEFEALMSDDVKEITLDARGKKVYRGILPLEETGEDIDVREISKNPTDTVVGLNISMPDEAKRLHALAELGNRFAVPLVRIEFLLGDEVGVHVNALVDFDKGKIAPGYDLYRKIVEKIAGYGSGENYFITRLSEGIASIAGSFPDSPVTVRTTDFKTNEYANLIGGKDYESEEANPMTGWRGLVRSLSPENRDAFKWELRAIKRARDMGNKNIKVMFPMVRDPKELTGGPELDAIGFRGAYQIMKEVGLERGVDGLKVGIMVEDETNVERIDDYINAGIDFASIGSNDLTQLVMATDRDNEKLQKIPWYGETNPAVINKIRRVIRICKERGVDISICGDAPSSNPEIVKILVEEGIGSMGVTPDSYLAAYRLIRKVEQDRRSQVAAVPTTEVLFTAN